MKFRSFRLSAALALLLGHAPVAQAAILQSPAYGTFTGTPMAAYGTVARDMGARFSDDLNVMDFGARCDGSTDDWQAFEDVASVATGYVPVGVAGTLPAWLTRITNQLATNLARHGVPGIHSHGSVSIKVPAGRCNLSKAWTFNLRAMTALSISGAGGGSTELAFTGDTDGLVVNVVAGGTEEHSTTSPGNPIYIHDLAFLQADSTNTTTGRAISIAAPTVLSHAVPVAPILIDRIFTTGAHSRAHLSQDWAIGISIQDLQTIFIRDSDFFHAEGGAGTEQSILLTSKQTNGFNPNSAGNLWLTDSNIVGGRYGVHVVGQAIQGVYVTNTPMTAVGHGINWVAASTGFNGPLGVINDSMSCQYDCVVTNYVGSVSVQGNEVIDGQTIAGTSWCGICVDNSGADNISNNSLLNLPDTERLGAGHYGTGIRLTELATTHGGSYPSNVIGNAIGTTDYVLVLGGTKIVAAGNAMLTDRKTAYPQKCFTDNTPTNEITRPALYGNTCNGVGLEQATNGMTHTGDEVIVGKLTPSALALTGAAVFDNLAVSALPTRCAAGDLRYTYNARKPGEAAGAGTGLMAMCSSGNRWTTTAGTTLSY